MPNYFTKRLYQIILSSAVINTLAQKHTDRHAHPLHSYPSRNTLNTCADPHTDPHPCTTHAHSPQSHSHNATDTHRYTNLRHTLHACVRIVYVLIHKLPIGPNQEAGTPPPATEESCPGRAAVGDARCRRSRHRWRWRSFLPGNHGCRTPTSLCRGCVSCTGLWSKRRSREAGHCSRRGGEDVAKRPRARRSPPQVSSELPWESAEQLAGLGPGRAAARRGGVSPGRRAGLLAQPGLTAGSGVGRSGWGWPFLPGFFHRLVVPQPPPQLPMRVAPYLTWLWWPRPGHPPPGFVHPHPGSKSFCSPSRWLDFTRMELSLALFGFGPRTFW